MNDAEIREIETRSANLFADHLKAINEGDLNTARSHLFIPERGAGRSIETYLKAMMDLRLFHLLSSRVKRFEDVRPKAHGVVATVWLEVVVRCLLGEKTTDIGIWWFPETNRYCISARPTQWVLESLRRS